jgi:hypothetical protein
MDVWVCLGHWFRGDWVAAVQFGMRKFAELQGGCRKEVVILPPENHAQEHGFLRRKKALVVFWMAIFGNVGVGWRSWKVFFLDSFCKV